MKTQLFKILEFVAAIILSAILFPVGTIYSFVLIFVLNLKFFKTVVYFIKELIFISFDVLEKLAIIIDRIGNVILGDMFIIFFVRKNFRNLTLFKKNEITISASFGHAYEWLYLNKRGVKFVKFLDAVFGKNHCKNAYQWYIIKENFKQGNRTGIS